ncbi:hypothetical protein ACJZ2D_001830 [Fusarium nematophilum]
MPSQSLAEDPRSQLPGRGPKTAHPPSVVDARGKSPSQKGSKWANFRSYSTRYSWHLDAWMVVIDRAGHRLAAVLGHSCGDPQLSTPGPSPQLSRTYPKVDPEFRGLLPNSTGPFLGTASLVEASPGLSTPLHPPLRPPEQASQKSASESATENTERRHACPPESPDF